MLRGHVEDTCSRLDYNGQVASNAGALAPLCCCIYQGKTYDSFDIKEWWVSVKEKLPGFFMVLRAVLTHAPNSAPPERLFSILNDSFGTDQTRARADYIEYSLLRQFNERTRD